MLNLGAIKGGLIVEQTTRREHPMGEIASRSIGYERFDKDSNVTRAGIDGALCGAAPRPAAVGRAM